MRGVRRSGWPDPSALAHVETDESEAQQAAGCAAVLWMEIRQGIARRRAHEARYRHKSSETAPIVPNVPVHVSDASARATLWKWHRRLLALDFDTAPEGFELQRWRQLCDDPWWLNENFASQLVRKGWSAHDIFGVLPWRPDDGVLLDRPQGARDLQLNGRGPAFR